MNENSNRPRETLHVTALRKRRKKKSTKVVFYTKVSFKTYYGRNKSKWHGACLDTGAQSTVIGLEQAKAYCKFMETEMNLNPSENRFRFGDNSQRSLGSIIMKIPLGDKRLIIEKVDVVKSDIPFLIGLDFMDKYKFYVNTVTNQLCAPLLELQIPLKRKKGHIYLTWCNSKETLFTKSELIKIHRGLSHPTTEKTFALLKAARPEETNAETRKVLDHIKKFCEVCQRTDHPPIRFKVSIPLTDGMKFCDEISMDLMFLDGKAVLHVVDTATHFSTATFLDAHGLEYGQTSEGIWTAFMETWVLPYLGFPNRMRTDHGSAFVSETWKTLCTENGITLRISGVQAHSSLGLGERYHEPLRRIYRKTMKEYPGVPRHMGLQLAVKAMNDTMGENGLVPTKLVFGTIPRFPIINSDLPSQKERMDALQIAQKEMNSIIAERRVRTALSKEVPPAADIVYQIGEEVLFHSEKEKEWIGPFIVTGISGRMITIVSSESSNEPKK